MILKLIWAQKRMFWAFEKSIFRFFFQIIEWQSWNHCLGKWAKVRETV